ncbi:NACHT domain-containing protein [Streptomyces sp. NPDC052077]|uniref:NACHT domain-containing protein n=1 Tax=Streptomyces sp. NPDC052077 TaxID=3154757 RepID=UPI0034403156
MSVITVEFGPGTGAGRMTMRAQPGGQEQPFISNTVVDSTIEYLVQVGVLHGDLNLSVRVAAPPGVSPLAEAERRLAASLLYQWRAEADAWHMNDPWPMPVQWRTWSERTPSSAAPPPGPVWADTGGGRTMADALLQLENRRLVVLGSAGSGKTVFTVLLALELLARRLGESPEPAPDRPGSPIPLMLSLESWDTRRATLDDWLEERLRRDHPGLPFVDGEHPARLLVRQRRVLPVLDGLDELPHHRRAEVCAALASGLGGIAHASGGPLLRGSGAVLVSRTEEYRLLLAEGHGLPGATTVESRPLPPLEAADYLAEVAENSGRSDDWRPLVLALRRQPDRFPAARALTSPLMVWLTREAYARRPADPAELVSPGAFHSPEEVETHLLDRIVHAAFPALPSHPDRRYRPRTWNPDRARGWLSYLARLMTRRGEGELAWWRLSSTPLVRALALPALLGVGVLVSFAVSAATPGLAPGPFRSELSVTAPLLGGVTYALVGRTMTQHWYGHPLGEPRRTADPFRFLAALRSVERHSRVGPALRLVVLLAGPALVVGLLAMYFLGGHDHALLLFSVGVVLPAVTMIVLAAPADVVDAATPAGLLRDERRALVTTATVVAPMIGLGTTLFWRTGQGTSNGIGPGITTWIGASVTLFLLSPWSRWLLARTSLALVGRVPWSLMRFLEDARAAGLLQRAGGSYRFRHRRLQEHLAGGARPPHGAPPAASARPSPPRPPARQPLLHPPARPPARSGDGPGGVLLFGPPAFSVEDSPGVFRVQGRSRRLPMFHWTLIGTFTAVMAIRMSVTGRLQEAGTWAALLLWPALGVLVTVVGLLLPARRMELELTAEGVRSSVGRRRSRHAWRHVEDIAVRRVVAHGQDAHFYALQVRPTPDAPRVGLRFRLDGGWAMVFPLGLTTDIDPPLAAALTRFAGPRWRQGARTGTD